MALADGIDLAKTENAKKLETKRPKKADRLFVSEEVERCIVDVKKQLTHPYLAYLFENCFPNTLDTTVYPEETKDGDDDTFVITGDIEAMWLRDSGAQVWPYLRFVAKDKELAKLIRGVIRRQFRCILIDPYAQIDSWSNKKANGMYFD